MRSEQCETCSGFAACGGDYLGLDTYAEKKIQEQLERACRVVTEKCRECERFEKCDGCGECGDCQEMRSEE